MKLNCYEQYAEGLITAYTTLTIAVDVWCNEFGGEFDNCKDLINERDERLQALSTGVINTVQMLGDLEIRSDGSFDGKNYVIRMDDHGYAHIIHNQNDTIARVTDWENRRYRWISQHFLQPVCRTRTICGEVRNTTHHIDDKKDDDNVFNLISVPNRFHPIFHPKLLAQKALNDPLLAAIKTRLEATQKSNQNLVVKQPGNGVVDARWLWTELGLTKPFSDWVKQLESAGFIFSPVGEIIHTDGRGRPRKDYTISKWDALEIAMTSGAPNSKRVRDGLKADLQTSHTLKVALAPYFDKKAAVSSLREFCPELMVGINTLLAQKDAELAAERARADAYEAIVGDGGYVPKRAVKRLKTELVNV